MTPEQTRELVEMLRKTMIWSLEREIGMSSTDSHDVYMAIQTLRYMGEGEEDERT